MRFKKHRVQLNPAVSAGLKSSMSLGVILQNNTQAWTLVLPVQLKYICAKLNLGFKHVIDWKTIFYKLLLDYVTMFKTKPHYIVSE